jgi:hypothetical protein
MTTVKEAIETIKNKTEQNADGQFKEGSKEQQYATRFVELFFTEYDTIVKNADPAEFPVLVAGVVNALRDLQVRDYMLGIVKDIDNSVDALEFLIEAAPEYADAARALVATVYYESDRPEDAINTINEASDEYSLAVLLKRVFSAGWPKESFAQMRSELHPKVVATIFGDEEE